MNRKKDFWVYEMKPVQDDKAGTPQAARTGTTAENNPTEITPDAAEPPPAPEPVTEPAPARVATPPFGISMVQGPPITIDLDLPIEPTPSSGPSSRTPSTKPHPSPMSFAERTMVATRVGTLLLIVVLSNVGPTVTHIPEALSTRTRSQTTSSVHFRSDALASVYSEELGVSNPSLYTLDREVKHYIKRRESAVYDFYPGVERTVYDYVSERNDLYTTNVLESTAHLIKGSLSGAVLSMHEAYMIGGLWTSLVVTIAVGFLTGYTMIMLITSAQKLYRRLRINKLSYPDLAEAAAATAPWNWVRNKSKVFRYTVEVTLTLQMIIISIDPTVYTWLYDIRLCILITFPLLLPLCLIKSLKWLSPFALVADIFVAICVMTTMYYSVLAFEHVNILDRPAWKDVHGFIRVFGICMYGISGISVALPVENNMKSPKYFPLVVRNATVIVTLLSLITGFFGYWAWGESCESPITVHMPRNIGTTILQFLLVMMLSITFALTLWVPFRIFWHYIIRTHKKNYSVWERIYRFIMTMLVTAISMIAPDTIPVMIFMGQFFLGFVALIFPASIEFLVNWEDQYASRSRVRFANNAKNFGLIVLGLSMSLTTSYSVPDR